MNGASSAVHSFSSQVSSGYVRPMLVRQRRDQRSHFIEVNRLERIEHGVFRRSMRKSWVACTIGRRANGRNLVDEEVLKV